MSAINSLLDSNLVYRLGITLLHSLWEGAAVLALLSLVMLAMRKASPQKRYAAATTAMLLLIAWPIATFFLISPSLKTVPTITSDSQPIGTSMVRIDSSSPAPIDSTLMQSLVPNSSRAGDAIPTTAEPFSERYKAALPWLVVIWFAGVALLALWNFGGWIALQQMRFITTHRAGEDAEHLTRLLSRRLGITRPVRVLKSTLARTPMVIGAIKPLILLPASAIAELSIAELESIIAHELAHIRRHDFVINLFQAVVETVLFYHPAVWLISARVRQERENCCDDLALSVTRDRASYVRALAAVASVRVTSLAPAASGGKLLPRLQRLLGVSDGSVGRPSRWSAGAVLLTLIISVALFTGSKAQDAANKSDPTSDDLVSIHGHVFDPQGKPVAGATVTTTRRWDFLQPLSTVQSQADGSYSISFRKSQFALAIDGWQGTVVAATLPGYGPGWARWDHTSESGDVDLKLAMDDIPIEGRMLDLEGRPIAGAHVEVESIHPKFVELSKMNIDGTDPTANPADAQPDVDGIILGGAHQITTGGDGKFRFTGIGRDRMVEMNVFGAELFRAKFQVNTRVGPTQSRGFQNFIKVTTTTYGPTFDYVAAPERAVHGTVRDAVTHAPLAGVKLLTRRWKIEAVTDAQGNYRLEGLPRDNSEQVSAVAPDDQPYITRTEWVNSTPDSKPVTLDFDLHRGIIVSGKITDKVSGAPVSRLELEYFPYLTNAAAQQLPEFTKEQMLPLGWARRQSHADGTFHIVVPPGQGVIGAFGGNQPYCEGEGADQLKVPRSPTGGMQAFGAIYRHPDHFMDIKDIDVDPNQPTAHLDLQCNPGKTIHVKLVDVDGKPVVGATTPSRPYVRQKTSTFDIEALGPYETRYVTIIDREQQLGHILKIKASDAPTGEMELKLEPWSYATGRLIDKDGLPVADAMLEGSTFMQFPCSTDASGHFKVLLLSGIPHKLDGIKNRTQFATDVKDLQLKSGETRDLGDVHAKMFN